MHVKNLACSSYSLSIFTEDMFQLKAFTKRILMLFSLSCFCDL